MQAYTRPFIYSCLLILSLAACGSGGDNPENRKETSSVENTLINLGVDITTTVRQDDNGEPLPADYSPFGSSSSFEQIDELLLLGFPLAAASGFQSEMTLLELDPDSLGTRYSSDVLFSPNPSLTPWALSVGADPDALRVAARGDFDRDGLQELAVLYRTPGQNSIELQIYQDQTMSFKIMQTLLISSEPANSLALASGDFNGDGHDELVVGMVFDNFARLLFLDNDNGSLSLPRESKVLPQAFAGSRIDLIIKTGNLDYDASYETVVLVNELFQRAALGNPETGTSRYFIFDDAKKKFNEIISGLVQADLGDLNRTAIVADVSLGDIDGDNLDELVFAGLTNFDPNGLCDYRYLLIVHDDLVHAHKPLGAKEQQSKIARGCENTPGGLRFVHVNTADLDADGVAEIQVNELIFEDFAQYLPWTPLLDSLGDVALIPVDSLFTNKTGFSGQFSYLNSAMEAADLTADTRQDIILYSQSSNLLEVWGLANPNREWRLLKSIPLQTPKTNDDLRPILVPINVNHDSLGITFDDGEYRLIFTEPVLIAALAAAPCYQNLGQNSDACRSFFGTAASSSVQTEDTFTITAGVTVGFESEFSAFGVKAAGIEMLATLKAHASRISSSAYTLTQRIVYTTGPLEDTVIFTTLPLDQYTYRINSHPDPELIGSKVVISMPRSPVEIQVERAFYNASVVAGGALIDASIFTHRIGDPRSYPSAGTKDQLLSEYSGYEFGPASVGQGAGNTTLEINIATETGIGTAYGVEFEFAVQATAGVVVAGFSVGFDAESSLQVIHGKESNYSGSVANLPASSFSDNAYDWGLFTYINDDHDSGQQFEVLNYWVN